MAGLAPISVASTVVGFISFVITLLTLASMHLLPFGIPRWLFCVSFVTFEWGLRNPFSGMERSQYLVMTVIRTRARERQNVFHAPKSYE
jgi:hypothetical protein